MLIRSWGPARVAAVIAAFAAFAVLTPAAAYAAPVAGAARVGSAPAAQQLSLELPLKIDRLGLARFASAVSTPGSPEYGGFESIARLSRRFGASASARAYVLAYLREAGATAVSIDPTGLYANATMSVSLAQRLFGTELADFDSGAVGGHGTFVAPAASAHVPAPLAADVTGVIGLDTAPLLRGTPARSLSSSRSATRALAAYGSSDPVRLDATGTGSAYPTRTGTGTGCAAGLAGPGFVPNQYLNAYGYDPLQHSGLKGQGERVALIEIDGFRESDVRAFDGCFGVRTPTVKAFGVGIRHPLPPGGETTLDLELLSAAAPELNAVDVYESSARATDVLHSLTAPLHNKGQRPDVISASLGSCEEQTQESLGVSGLNTIEESLELAAANGISMLAAAGDDGSTACLNEVGNPVDALAVSYPASSPWVTGVGGTNLLLNAANQITAQTVWNDAPLAVGAAGGGTSALFRRPAYQKGFSPSARRAVPDVAMLADLAPGYEIYCTAKPVCKGKGWVTIGGTSAGTPLLAGGFALIDQALRQAGHTNLGFANPLLYRVDASASGPSVFSDVTSGSNDLFAPQGKPAGCCSAAVGFDQASGLGGVNVEALTLAAAANRPKLAAVSLKLPAQRRPVAAEHLLASVSCSRGCLLSAHAQIRIGSGRRLKLTASVYMLDRKGTKTIRLPLSAKARKALDAGLRRHAPITATVYGTVVDPSGKIERHSRPKRLRISG